MMEALKKDERGLSQYVGTIISLMIILAVVYCFVQLVPLIVGKINIDHATRQLARTIELSGEAGELYEQEIDRLKRELGIDFAVTLTGVQPGGKLQLRQQFRITVTVTINLTLTTPAFGDPILLPVTLQTTHTGYSEVYWKELA